MTEYADLTAAALLQAAQSKIGGGTWVLLTAEDLWGMRVCKRAKDAQFACALHFTGLSFVVWAIYVGGDTYEIHTEITDCGESTILRYDIPAETLLEDCIEAPATLLSRLETQQIGIAQAILALGG